MSPQALLMSPTANGNGANHYSYVASKFFMMIVYSIKVLLLAVLFALSLVVWLWVACFRAGWRFGEWADSRGSSESIPLGLAYGLAVLAIAPLLLFIEWSQKRFGDLWPKWAQFPEKSYVRELFERQLGINLGEELPFLRGKEPVEALEDGTQSALPEG